MPHSSYDILDVIYTKGMEVTGWMFTMSDGKVKSKSKGRWNMQAVADRCQDYDGNICGQVLVDDIWLQLNRENFEVDGRQQCVVSSAQVSRMHQYIEQVFEKQQGIIKPKMTSYRLCDSSVKGQSIPKTSSASEIKQFPTQRLVCSQKQIVELMKEKMALLIQILEQRTKTEISKLTCVFVVEDLGESKYRIKLHHAKEVNACPRKVAKLGRQKSGASSTETRSEISDVTNISRGTIRKTKCTGDFCTFCEEEENSLSEMDRELNFDIAIERTKAERRHKRLDDGRFGVSTDDDDTDYGHMGEMDDDIADAYRAHVLAATGGRATTDPVHPKNCRLPSSTSSYKVPLKSLLLARKEMKVIDTILHTSDSKYIDNDEVSHWWNNLVAWYKRAGHAIVQKSLPSIPASSGHHIGRAMLHIAEHGDIPDGNDIDESLKSLANIRESPELTVNSLQNMLEDGGVSPSKSKFVKDVPYDLSENPYQNSQVTSGKHIGRYYSSATVCDACYRVYKELDRLRKKRFKDNLRSKKQEAEEKAREDELHLARHMDSVDRQTNQKVLTYRLAKSKNVRVKKGSLLEDNSQSTVSLPQLSSSVVGAPKGQLPPMPWQLGQNDKRKEYEQQGSSFVRNIQNKAQQMSESAARTNKKYRDDNYEDKEVVEGLGQDFDWRKVVASQYPTNQQQRVKSLSAGNAQRRQRQQKQLPKKKFDSDRLLHPYQRQLAAMRRSDSLDDGEIEAPVATIYQQPAIKQHKLRHSKSESNVMGVHKKQQGTISLPSLHSNMTTTARGSENGGLPPLVPKTKTQYNNLAEASKQQVLKSNIIPAVLLSQSPAKTPKAVSFAGQVPHQGLEGSGDDSDDEGDDDDDDEIGWSPFMINVQS